MADQNSVMLSPMEDRVGKSRPISDDESYDTDLDEAFPPDHDGLQATRAYLESCKILNVHPVQVVVETLNACDTDLNLRYRNMGPTHAKALAAGLTYNASIEYLDLREIGLGGEGGMHIGDMLKENHYIVDLNLDRNNLGTVGTAMIGEALSVNNCLTSLTLSNNNIADAEVKYLAAGLEQNHTLVFLDVSRNNIGEDGAKSLSNALGDSNLERLNLSWNMIRRKGAVAICKALSNNTSLKDLDISWNGFGFEGSLAIGELMKVNTCLRDLDLTNNRIHWEGAKFIAMGLMVNGTLETIKIGMNPITMSGCQRLLDAACAPSSALAYIGFDGIPINSTIMEKARKIMTNRAMTLIHAQVHDTVEVFGTKKPRRKDDPLQMLFRHLHHRGIRVMDLFRTFYTDNDNRVTIDQFIRGLKKCYLPMTEQEMMKAAKSIQDHTGKISYQDIKSGVRSVTMEIRAEERKKAEEENKRKQERARIMYVPEDRRLQALMQGEDLTNSNSGLQGGTKSGDSSSPQALSMSTVTGPRRSSLGPSSLAEKFADSEAGELYSNSLTGLEKSAKVKKKRAKKRGDTK